MTENYVSICRVVVTTVWGSAAGMLAAAWVLAIAAGDWHVGVMLAMTAVVVSVVSAVLHVRLYFSRSCSLLRALHGVEGGERAPLHMVR